MTNADEMRKIANLLEASNQLPATKPTIGIDHDKFNAALDRGDHDTIVQLWSDGRSSIRDVINNYRVGDTFTVYTHDGHYTSGFDTSIHTLEAVQLDKNENGVVVISQEGEDYTHEITGRGTQTLDYDAFDYDNYVTIAEEDLTIIDTMYGIESGSPEELEPNLWKPENYSDDRYTLRGLFDMMSNQYELDVR